MAFVAVTFSPVEFFELYPQFQGSDSTSRGYISPNQLSALWEVAVTIVGNTEDTAVVPFDPDKGVFKRKILLYALMCHLATLALWGADGQQGTLASASEGSVSASFQIPQIQGGITSQWYNQTLCGRTAWMLLKPYCLGGKYYGIKYFHPYG